MIQGPLFQEGDRIVINQNGPPALVGRHGTVLGSCSYAVPVRLDGWKTGDSYVAHSSYLRKLNLLEDFVGQVMRNG